MGFSCKKELCQSDSRFTDISHSGFLSFSFLFFSFLFFSFLFFSFLFFSFLFFSFSNIFQQSCGLDAVEVNLPASELDNKEQVDEYLTEIQDFIMVLFFLF